MTHGVVSEENRTPLVLDKEKTVDEDEDHGEDDQHDDHEAAVKVAHTGVCPVQRGD